MDTIEIQLLIAIIFLAVAVLGGGTMVFCCTGFDNSLPYMSLSELDGMIKDMESEHHFLAKDLIGTINNVSSALKKQAGEIPGNTLITDQSTFVDLEMGLYSDQDEEHATLGGGVCQHRLITVSPAAQDVVIHIPEDMAWRNDADNMEWRNDADNIGWRNDADNW